MSVPEQTQLRGGYVEYRILCTEPNCRHEKTWQSSDVENQTYVINLLLSASILFAGGVASKFFRALQFINVKVPSLRTFFRHQKEYLHGVRMI